MRKSALLIGGIVTVLLTSCGSEQTKTSTPERLQVEIPTEEIPIEKIRVMRLDSAMFDYKGEQFGTLHEKLNSQFGNFYTNFIRIISNTAGSKDSSLAFNLKLFTRDKYMKETYDECKKVFPDMHFLESALTDVIARYQHYFPKATHPAFISFVSGFKSDILFMDNTIGISLDMFLGYNNRLYKMLPPDFLPNYKRRRMQKQYITPQLVEQWMQSEFPDNTKEPDLLSKMIYYGKILYLTDALLPNIHDSLKIGYTSKQLAWSVQNEYNLWAHLIQQKFLYDSSPNVIRKFTNDGPFVASIHHDCPARIAYWIGWQIVRKYMEENEKVSLVQLMKITDAHQILVKSKYKPKK